MKNNMKMTAVMASGLMALSLLTGCVGTNPIKDTAESSAETVVITGENSTQDETSSANGSSVNESQSQSTANSGAAVPTIQSGESGEASVTSYSAAEGGAIDASELFTDRDLTQTPDLSEAVQYTVSDGETVTLSSDGVYVFTGSAENYEIIVDADDSAKVQIVLDGVSITNESVPCIYVKNADKVFVTSTASENNLTVSGTFTEDEDTNTDAVIFSRDDLVLNGLGTVTVSSTENGISGKDDIKITGGTWNISCTADAVEANDSIVMADGTVNISTAKDGFHAENDEDNTTGYIYIAGGTVNVEAGDDAIHAITILQIDGGTITLNAAEGLEATWVQVNGGDISINASDDGINAGRKSNAYTVLAEFNGGNITIQMGAGDTDGIDSNGNLIINGGTISINAQSPFDYDGALEKNGGTLIVNGQETDSITNQFGGGMGGGKGGNAPGGNFGGVPGYGADGSSEGNGTEEFGYGYGHGPQGHGGYKH